MSYDTFCFITADSGFRLPGLLMWIYNRHNKKIRKNLKDLIKKNTYF